MTTPMIQQYREAKERHPGMLLLFRLERRGWAFSAASAAAGAVACYALFQLWLKTQLPTGPLGF